VGARRRGLQKVTLPLNPACSSERKKEVESDSFGPKGNLHPYFFVEGVGRRGKKKRGSRKFTKKKH